MTPANISANFCKNLKWPHLNTKWQGVGGGVEPERRREGKLGRVLVHITKLGRKYHQDRMYARNLQYINSFCFELKKTLVIPFWSKFFGNDDSSYLIIPCAVWSRYPAFDLVRTLFIFCLVVVLFSRRAVQIEAVNNIGEYHDRICIVFYAIVIK